ncbi:MAG: cobalt-precorrin-6A reductase [Rhodomicrobium sp.]
MRLLLLGGSTEASALAKLLAADRRFEATLSLAGRPATPRAQPIAVRTGGFGGVEGLVRYLREERIDVLIDATHPFAAQMSRNAIAAASIAGTPLLAVERPAWERQPGDSWTIVPDMASAVAALGEKPRIVFTVGSLAVPELLAAPQHTYIVRLIDMPAMASGLPNIKFVQGRGPFTAGDDIRLFRCRRIEVVLAKNSGGHATASKIQAARALKLPVIMVERPFVPPRSAVPAAEYAMIWLIRQHKCSMPRGV